MSGSDSEAFHLLHPAIQKWIWSRQWKDLRDAQERATRPILAGDRDVIIAAATASGKTEAAFLPIMSALLAADTSGSGIQALYISPLKALINDQYGRLDELGEQTGLAVHRWHGDVPGSRKHKMLNDPSGLLLITPESLEALFVVHGPRIGSLFGRLAYIVVDEIHTFIGTERGAQLRSLLHRVELATRRRIPRIGLSATLSEMEVACDWLRPVRGAGVEVIEAHDDDAEIKLQVRGYLVAKPKEESPDTADPDAAWDLDPSGNEDPSDGGLGAIADHLFVTHRGSDGLVFANSRGMVETLADMLTRRSERERLPNEFVPHHGNLSRILREHVEARLKDRTMPVTAVCTSTLEMGIDIGSVAAVAQVGPPPSVAALRQRLGRSGRRGEAAVLRCYVQEDEVTTDTSLIDQIRGGLFQTVAMVELLLGRWCEAPESGDLHLSTLVQQLLSLIAQHGGVRPKEAHGALCASGPFENVSAPVFAALLRALADHDLITQQASDGLLLLGREGERQVNHYSFYAAFQSPEEFRLVSEGKPLGTLPVGFPLTEGMLIIFAGRRWRIEAIDDRAKVIEVVKASGGRPPRFSGGKAEVADEVRRRMREVYISDDIPAYLDRAARELLQEGRDNFRRNSLHSSAIVSVLDRETHLVVWRGDRVMSTLAVALASLGVQADRRDMVLTVDCDATTLAAAIRSLAGSGRPPAEELARHVRTKMVQKWDAVLDEGLLDLASAHRDLDVEGAWDELGRLAARA